MAESTDLQMFLMAFKAITTDKGFEIGTDEAQKSLLIADKIIKWIKANEKEAETFASSLIRSIRLCCTHPRPVTCHTFKERMWEKYYKLCSSQEFRSSWIKFFVTTHIGFNACPIVYQFVTKKIMEEIIKSQFPVIATPTCSLETVAPLDFEEGNALRYCGGYLLRSLKKKVERKSNRHPLKNSLLLCLQDLLEDQDMHTEEESEKWLKSVNRGGLVAINDTMYQLLVAMELELRRHFTATNASANESIKDIAYKEILENDDVLFYWTMISVNWDSAESTELLKMIVEHYITVRGFSFASSFMEQYKQSEKKSTQKSKGLRKKLTASTE